MSPNIPNFIEILDETPIKYRCTICTRTFKTKGNIKYHKYCNGAPKPLKCPHCGRDFITRSHYQYHLRTSHAIVEQSSRKTKGKDRDRQPTNPTYNPSQYRPHHHNHH